MNLFFILSISLKVANKFLASSIEVRFLLAQKLNKLFRKSLPYLPLRWSQSLNLLLLPDFFFGLMHIAYFEIVFLFISTFHDTWLYNFSIFRIVFVSFYKLSLLIIFKDYQLPGRVSISLSPFPAYEKRV